MAGMRARGMPKTPAALNTPQVGHRGEEQGEQAKAVPDSDLAEETGGEKQPMCPKCDHTLDILGRCPNPNCPGKK